MKTWATRTAVAMAFVVVALGAGTPTGASSGLCIPVRATGIGQDLGEFKTEATIFVAGVPVGTTEAQFVPDLPPDGTTLTFSGPIVFTAALGLGTFTVPVDGSVDLSTGEFEAVGPVTGGTGLFRGVSGKLTFAGVQDLTGAFTETVEGRLCWGRRTAATAVFEAGGRLALSG